ncbi:MAG: hypothetical protein LUG55_08030 [Clostridiales bacterium]|nr:hypothetical protein [Clostridiales bacterium]
MENIIRIGKVSSINYANGTARVTYEDKGSSTSAEFAFLAWEYWMPKIGDQVLVAHLSNGTSSAIILGPVWNSSNRPYTGGSGIYRKEMSNTKNKAVITYSDTTGILRLRAGHLTFEAYSDGVELTLQQIQDAIDQLNDLANAVVTLQDDVSDVKKEISSIEKEISDIKARLDAAGI